MICLVAIERARPASRSHSSASLRHSSAFSTWPLLFERLGCSKHGQVNAPGRYGFRCFK
jgi:hypothetical protein